MKVFLDTNVLTSALATRGLCHELFITVISEHQLITSNDVLIELERILKRKIKLPGKIIDNFVLLISEEAIIVSSKYELNDIPDPDDAPIIAAAIEAYAAYFVTGDKELLKLKQVNKLPIISPRNFWNALVQEATN